jgi:hypothetical protein
LKDKNLVEIEYQFQEFSDNQQRIYDRMARHYQAYRELSQKSRAFRGGMHWKRIKGREYLYQYRDRHGQGRSLGPRSPQTEEVYAAFGRGRREIQEQLRTQRLLLAEEARFCQAALLQRVPRVTAKLLRRLEQHDLLGSNLTVVGANAIYAYEFAGGVFLAGPRKSARACGLLAGSRTGLALATPRDLDFDFSALLTVLRQADRSFAALPGKEFQAVNRRGYGVKVLSAGTQGLGKSRNQGHTPGGAETHDFPSLLASPKFSQVVIADDGFPVTMVVPDPRAFALHKLWLSRQEDREPGKRVRDRAQAIALAELILRYLPQYDFFSTQLHLFPAEVVRQAQGLVEGYELTADLEVEG